MKKYKVEFSDEAVANLESSFEWGSEKWGVKEATRWYFDIQDSIQETLGVSPLGCPLAPYQDRYTAQARVLIVGRYNVIFYVERNTVLIVHVRGPFT